MKGGVQSPTRLVSASMNWLPRISRRLGETRLVGTLFVAILMTEGFGNVPTLIAKGTGAVHRSCGF